MLRRLLIGVAIAALPALAGAQTALTSTEKGAPRVTQLVPAPPNIDRPNHPNHPNHPNRPHRPNPNFPNRNNSMYGNGLSPVVLLNGYAIPATPPANVKHKARVHQSSGIQQDQFGSWSTSGR